MDTNICQTIKKLRLSKNISQDTLAKALGISTQAVSKWENQKALPDIMLLPAIAKFFDVSIDALFAGQTVAKEILPVSIMEDISTNHDAWDHISSGDWTGTALPWWGVYIPNEEQLHFLDDITGKKVVELACGDGQSLVYCGKKKPKELWGLDISEVQIAKAKKLMAEHNLTANFYLSPMEINPGIPEHYFDYIYSIYGIGWTQDLDKTISLAAKYLKTNGIFIFSWDNPVIACLDTINGQYVLKRSYVDEWKIRTKQRGEKVVRTNWKLSSYINSLAKHGLKVEQLVEDSSDIGEDVVFTDDYYSEYKARYIHHTFVIKARKL